MIDGDDTYDAVRRCPRCCARSSRGRTTTSPGCGSHSTTAPTAPATSWATGSSTGSVSVIFGRPVNDMLSGYRVFSRRFVKSFPAISRAFEIETELTVHAINNRVPQAEVPVGFKDRAGRLGQQAAHLPRRLPHRADDLPAAAPRAPPRPLLDDRSARGAHGHRPRHPGRRGVPAAPASSAASRPPSSPPRSSSWRSSCSWSASCSTACARSARRTPASPTWRSPLPHGSDSARRSRHRRLPRSPSRSPRRSTCEHQRRRRRLRRRTRPGVVPDVGDRRSSGRDDEVVLVDHGVSAAPGRGRRAGRDPARQRRVRRRVRRWRRCHLGRRPGLRQLRCRAAAGRAGGPRLSRRRPRGRPGRRARRARRPARNGQLRRAAGAPLGPQLVRRLRRARLSSRRVRSNSPRSPARSSPAVGRCGTCSAAWTSRTSCTTRTPTSACGATWPASTVVYCPDAVATHAYDFSRNSSKMFHLERNRLLTVLGDYPPHLLARVVPVLLLLEPLYLVIAARDGWATEKLRAWGWLARHPGRIAHAAQAGPGRGPRAARPRRHPHPRDHADPAGATGGRGTAQPRHAALLAAGRPSAAGRALRGSGRGARTSSCSARTRRTPRSRGC